MRNSFRKSSMAGVIIALGCSSSLSAQGVYTDLGTGSANSISDDGSVVVGKDGETYRWTAIGGRVTIRPFEGLGGLAAVSGDGNIAVTDIKNGNGDTVAGAWMQVPGWLSLGFLPNALRCPSRSDAYDISADGSTVVGLSWDGCSGRAFKWDAFNGMVDLSRLGTGSARANAVSGDGSTVGGWEWATNGTRRATAWFPNGTQALLVPTTPANPDGAGEVWAINHDGSVIVGGEDVGNPFRWTTANGYEQLGPVPGQQNTPAPFAYGTNRDGSRIVGGVGTAFGSPVAFIWTEEDGTQRLDRFLETHGILVPAGPALAWAFDITPDGKFIIGQRGANGFVGARGFHVRLPEGIRYGIGAAPANILPLSGSGSDQIGGTLVATTRNLMASSVSTILSSAAAKSPFLGGMFLVDLGVPVVILNAQAASGVATVNIHLPNVPALVGVSFFAQSMALDPRPQFGVALSNGMKVTVRQ